MTSKVVTLRADENVSSFRDVLYDHGFRHVPVVDAEGYLVGLVTERDLLRNVLTDQADVPISVREEVMYSTQIGDIMVQDVQTVEPDDLLPHFPDEAAVRAASLRAHVLTERPIFCRFRVDVDHLGLLDEIQNPGARGLGTEEWREAVHRAAAEPLEVVEVRIMVPLYPFISDEVVEMLK